MKEIIGKWVQVEGQPYAGLWFEFKEDGQFEAEYEPMGITSSGTYEVEGDQITMQQKEHTFGLVGEFKGRFSIENGTMKLALPAGAGQDRPDNLSDARTYKQV